MRVMLETATRVMENFNLLNQHFCVLHVNAFAHVEHTQTNRLKSIVHSIEKSAAGCSFIVVHCKAGEKEQKTFGIRLALERDEDAAEETRSVCINFSNKLKLLRSIRSGGGEVNTTEMNQYHGRMIPRRRFPADGYEASSPFNWKPSIDMLLVRCL
jgi:hypothetical protein